MNTPAAPHDPTAPVLIGALAPLTPPGWVDAGHHLLTGLQTAADHVNATGGIHGRPLRLLVRDTAADPDRAAAAVDELADLGVTALAGEYHSVVARAAAARAHRRALPFLCSSAVLDTLTDHPSPWIARLAPAQSHGWRTYADFLLARGHHRIAVTAQPSAYWQAGTRILHDHLTPRGATLITLDADPHHPQAVRDALAHHRATALLILTGVPEPALPLVTALRRDPRLTGLLIGAPAGQPELPTWTDRLGPDGAQIPFLSYLPPTLDPAAEQVRTTLRRRLGREPSFVAYEGHDTITVLAHALREHGTDRTALAHAWPHLDVQGTRGRIRFTPATDTGPHQWQWAPVQVVDRDPHHPDRLRVLHQG
ncbi:ABC transporter substrate-binding protein [Nocardiopsis sp. NPDC057823]|uniref:ABC transporter substrate-binding protein n=1 Tax=Nocardiopsis sp. NPDC057823 TaxID=3346256 RepID=UPI00366F7F11